MKNQCQDAQSRDKTQTNSAQRNQYNLVIFITMICGQQQLEKAMKTLSASNRSEDVSLPAN